MTVRWNVITLCVVALVLGFVAGVTTGTTLVYQAVGDRPSPACEDILNCVP